MYPSNFRNFDFSNVQQPVIASEINQPKQTKSRQLAAKLTLDDIYRQILMQILKMQYKFEGGTCCV